MAVKNPGMGGVRNGAGRKPGRPAYSASAAERVRARIVTGKLIDRLMKCADGTLPIADAPIESARIRAAEILLRKTLPDLDRTEIVGEGGGPITAIILKDD